MSVIKVTFYWHSEVDGRYTSNRKSLEEDVQDVFVSVLSAAAWRTVEAGEASIARMDKMRNATGPIPTAVLRRELQAGSVGSPMVSSG